MAPFGPIKPGLFWSWSSLWGVLRMTVRLFGGLLAAMVALGFTVTAHAKTDPSESAWAGYGDTGYIGKAKTSKSSSFKKAVYSGGYVSKKKYSKKSGTKVAALKYGYSDANDGYGGYSTPSKPKKKITGYSGGGVRWVANSGCLNGSLRALVASVAANYGSVTVSSTCRSRGHNASVGGAKSSHHLTGNAVDFRVHGNYGGVYAYLRANAGGVHHYGGGLFHADTGPKRTW